MRSQQVYSPETSTHRHESRLTKPCTTSSARLLRKGQKPQYPTSLHQLRRLGEDEATKSDRKFGARAVRSGIRCADGAGVPQAVRCLLRHQRDEGMLVPFAEIFLFDLWLYSLRTACLYLLVDFVSLMLNFRS